MLFCTRRFADRLQKFGSLRGVESLELIVLGHRLVHPSQPHQRDPAVLHRFREIGLQLQRLVVRRERPGVVAEIAPAVTEIVPRFREIRIELDRLVVLLERDFEFLGGFGAVGTREQIVGALLVFDAEVIGSRRLIGVLLGGFLT